MEPYYIAQNAETVDSSERQRWIIFHINRSNAAFWRATYDEEQNLILFEGWKNRPEEPGEPRWQMSPMMESIF